MSKIRKDEQTTTTNKQKKLIENNMLQIYSALLTLIYHILSRIGLFVSLKLGFGGSDY
eukprot:gene9864-6936_t